MDGTAKGGAVFGIREELPLPVKFIGVGEGIDDLEPFSAEGFVDAILNFERGSSRSS
jgi:fused signal recognition particle receptor